VNKEEKIKFTMNSWTQCT